DQSAFLDNRGAEIISRRLDGRPGKRLDGTKYMPLRHDARSRAASLIARHEQDGTEFPNNNPSSTVHKLLAAIEGIG
ncbi:MAG TPA: hypothetical protein VFI00_04610, partial [Kribbella sp.]|nr:hypothetical protein [Kribbella sp.]